MKNRPLLSVCLMVLCIIASMVVWGRERFIKELRPSPIERYAAEGDNITICGKIYRQEQKENCRMIYLKENSIYSNSKKFQESKIIIYTNSSQKLHIGNQLKVCGKVSFYEEARNPGNFDQKFYYQKQGIHGKVRSDDIQITDYKRNKLKDRLEKFRMNWQKMLQREMGERDGSALAAILLGEKSGMDQEMKELYQVNGIGHILAISGVKTLKLDIPLVPETRINWAFMPLHIVIIYILKLCLDEEIIPRCRFPCSRGYFKKCINYQKKQLFSVSQSYCKSLINQQKEKKPMAYKKYREMKVYEASGYQYKRTPSIVLKGQWLSELGFDFGEQIEVKCEDGRLIITKANEIWT